jgi:hypothetical protein
VRAQDPQQVVRALGLRTVLAANWRAGLELGRENGVFVAPPVDGWVLAVGADLFLDPQHDAIPAVLCRLSAAFGTAAWFATDERVDRHGWSLAQDGGIVRGYAFAGERGHVSWIGEVTQAEHALGCFVDDPRDTSDDDVKWWPDERTVLDLAAAWSLDPRTIASRAFAPSVGWFGRL